MGERSYRRYLRRRRPSYSISSGTTSVLTPSTLSVAKSSRSSLRRVPKPDPPSVWENIILHYLSKLRNVWGGSHKPAPVIKEPCLSYKHNKKHRRPVMNRALPKKIPIQQSGNRTRKAFNIVTDAVAYGIAKGVVKKNGKFFYLMDQNAKPPLARCRSCKACNAMNKKKCRHITKNVRKNLKPLKRLGKKMNIKPHGKTCTCKKCVKV